MKKEDQVAPFGSDTQWGDATAANLPLNDTKDSIQLTSQTNSRTGSQGKEIFVDSKDKKNKDLNKIAPNPNTNTGLDHHPRQTNVSPDKNSAQNPKQANVKGIAAKPKKSTK